MPTRRTIDTAERQARLAVRHRLTTADRTDDVAAIADGVVALHSSDPVSVYLSATARMASPSLAAVEAAIYDDRTLVRHHAMRRTLWVATPAVTRLTHASSTRSLVEPETKRTAGFLEAAGVTDDGRAWLAAARRDVLAALTALGTASARAIGDAVPHVRTPLRFAEGKAYEGVQGAHTRVLLLLGFDGVAVRVRPTGIVDQRPVPLDHHVVLAPRPRRRARPDRHGRGSRRAGRALATGVRPGHDGRRGVVDRLGPQQDPPRR